MGQCHSKSDITHQRESSLTDLPKASDISQILGLVGITVTIV